MDILSRFEATVRRAPEHAAFIDQTGICSFRNLAVQAQCCASLLHSIGVSAGDRCIVAEENSTTTAIAIIAIWYCGGIPVFVHSSSTNNQMTQVITKTEPKLLLASTDLQNANHANTYSCLSSHSLVAASLGQRTPPWITDRSPVSASMIASIVFTSGSSGGPKGVAQTHQSLLSGCLSVYQCLGYCPEDSLLCPVPWSFDYGFGQLLSTLLTGITQIIPVGKSPFETCAALAEHKPTILVGVPSMFAGLCQGLSPISTTNTSSVRLLTSTGSRLHSSTMNAIRESFPDSGMSLNYGLTETYRSASLPADAFETHHNSVGKAIPGAAISIVRPDGSIADIGESGEIVHSGCGVFSGYWGDPERTQITRRRDPLWPLDGIPAPPAVFTGDLGWKDKNGFLYIKGRKDRQIKTMGILVSPDDIETTLLNLSFIKEVAIISKPHEILGEFIIAVCTLQPDSQQSIREIKAYCRKTMSPYMMPRKFHLIQTMPRTGTGKVDYLQLRDVYTRDLVAKEPEQA